MAKTVRDVMKMIRDLEIQMVDFKMVDIHGQFRHVTIPAKNFNEEIMENGVGFDASNYGYAVVEKSDMVFIPDPDTGAYCPPSLIHISDRHAQQQGMPYAIDFGAQTEGNICHMICNWMGDDGFLKYLYCQARRINIIGDINWIKGYVDKKYVDEDGDHVAALKVWAENQDGVKFMPGDAIVKLVSKEGRYI